MSQSTNNTQLLITIGAFTAFIAVSKWFKSQNEAPRPEMKASIQADMTLAELKQYDGEVKPEIFLALKGVIYDVSSSGIKYALLRFLQKARWILCIRRS
jgi:hypothetical protein